MCCNFTVVNRIVVFNAPFIDAEGVTQGFEFMSECLQAVASAGTRMLMERFSSEAPTITLGCSILICCLEKKKKSCSSHRISMQGHGKDFETISVRDATQIVLQPTSHFTHVTRRWRDGALRTNRRRQIG